MKIVIFLSIVRLYSCRKRKMLVMYQRLNESKIGKSEKYEKFFTKPNLPKTAEIQLLLGLYACLSESKFASVECLYLMVRMLF